MILHNPIVSGSLTLSSNATFTANNGTVSGSTQIISLLPSGVVSGSIQVNADTIANFDTNVRDYIRSLDVVSGSSQLTTEFDTRYLNTTGDGVISGSSQISLSGFNTSQLSENTNLYYTDARVKTKLNAETVVSGSSQITKTKSDVGLGNVDNESKATMFSSPALTGNPTAPTQADNDNSTKIATTAYVQREVSDLLGGAPAAFDTLLEISASIANGDSDVVALTTVVGGKLQKDQNLSDLTNPGTARTNLGVANTQNISEHSSNLYYTDTRVKTKLNAETVISGSSQVNANTITNFDTNVRDYVRSIDVISGSSQVNADSITNFDTNVQSFIRATDVISGSSQVTGISNTQISGVNHSKVDFGGSNLTSGSLGLVVGDGSSTDTVNVGVDTLAIIGTANEVTTAVTNNQVQIGLPDNVTVGGNMVVSGNLTVSGDTVQTNVTNLNIQDNIINVNYGGSATDGGLYVSDVTGGNLVSGSLLWDGSNDYWKAGAKDSEARVILGNGTDTAGKITKFSADGVITDSIISESGTTVTISNDLILSGLTASSFLISNGSKQLVSVASSTDGDFLVSNGSGTYSATNIIDGGSF